MATHDYVIANGTGAAVRSDLNDALAAIVSNNSSSSEPATTYAYQWWADTTANVLKIRNSANNAWVTLRELDGTMLIEDGSAASPGLAFADDTNTGIFSSGADQLGLSTNGVERISVGTGSVILNNDGNDVDFRVESNGEDHMLFVDGGNNRVGIGCAAPVARLEVSDDTQTDVTAGDLVVDTTGLSADVIIGRLSSRSNDNTSFRVRNRVDSTILSASSGTPLTVGHSTGEAMRVDNSRRMIIGSSTLRTFNTHSSRFQVQGTDFSSQTASIVANSADGNGGFLFFAKQRSGAAGGNTIVQDGDLIGQLRFNACDGVDMETLCASIDVNIDGTPGSNDLPGRITFRTTADGASSTTERLRIDNQGILGVGHTPSGWGGARKAIQFNSAGAAYLCNNSSMGVVSNTYFNGSNDKYIDAGSASAVYVQNDNVVFNFAGSGSADANASFVTSVRVDSDGVKFGSDTAAVNALDDYEEGTFTPAISFSSLSVSSYDSQQGSYVKVGRQVHVSIYIRFSGSNLSGTASTGGSLSIALPFTAGTGYSASQYIPGPAAVGRIGEFRGTNDSTDFDTIYHYVSNNSNNLVFGVNKMPPSPITTDFLYTMSEKSFNGLKGNSYNFEYRHAFTYESYS